VISKKKRSIKKVTFLKFDITDEEAEKDGGSRNVELESDGSIPVPQEVPKPVLNHSIDKELANF
jgi:hypothetical protein